MAGKESTDLSAGVKFERETEAHKERLAEVAEGTLLAQACSPEDVADAVMFLAGAGASAITGEHILVDAGRS